MKIYVRRSYKPNGQRNSTKYVYVKKYCQNTQNLNIMTRLYLIRNSELLDSILDALDIILRNSNNAAKCRILKKLNSLYHGKHIKVKDMYFCLRDEVDCFINLSNYELNKNEKEFLNLGLNCHLESKYDKLSKKVELEMLYQNLLNLESQNKIVIKQELADQLRAESTKHRNIAYPKLLTPSLRIAAQNLKNNDEIVIRKADKSTTYVIMDKKEYLNKIDEILSDQSKFKMIKRNPVEKIKQKANKLIKAQNADTNALKLSEIVGDYRPGYAYGNVKTHKKDNPLRPIISQIPSPTYKLAKSINSIIAPYIPDQYSLKSSDDFIDLLQENDNAGMLASLDVESLFTNVPIDPTIDIILKYVYNHPVIPPPKIPKLILKELLELCTKEAPFKCPNGKMYVQIEGVAMGSPLGPTFANYYMGHLEETLFENSNLKPRIYGRYIDDIFVQVENEAQLINLMREMRENSVLNFTYELNVNDKLPFLDVLVDNSGNKFRTSVYHKPTDEGFCLNGDSQCTEKYKTSVITNYLNRAYKLSSTWEEFHLEVLHIKQRLVNNNYSNTVIDKYIKSFLDQKQVKSPNSQGKSIIPVYYAGQNHANYKTDERILKNLVYQNTKCCHENNKLEFRIYYKNKKTCSLVMRNNLGPPLSKKEETNVIYKFTCPLSHGQATDYIGFTQSTLSQRLVSHGQHGSINDHFKQDHKRKPSHKELVDNTTIIGRADGRNRLAIKEALFILHEKPMINKQYDNFNKVLKLHRTRNEQKVHYEVMTSQETLVPPHMPPLPSKNSTSNENFKPVIQVPHEAQLIPTCPTGHSDSIISVPPNTPPPHAVPKPNLSDYSPRTIHLLTSPININKLVSTDREESGSTSPAQVRSINTSEKQLAIKNLDHNEKSCLPDFSLSPPFIPCTLVTSEGSGGDGQVCEIDINQIDDSFDSNSVTRTASIPDMCDVLRGFDIEPDKLAEVTISESQFSDFSSEIESTCEDSPTISQRIRTLVRKARFKSNLTYTEEAFE